MGRSGTNWGAEFPRFTIDLTGDGKADILGFGTDGVWVSLNDGGGRFSTPSFVPNDSSGQGQFGYAQEWRIEKHVRTLGEIADPLRAKLGDAVSTLNLKTDPVRTKLGNAINPLNFKTAAAPRPEAATSAAVAKSTTATSVAAPSSFARIHGADIVGFGDVASG